MQRLKYRKDIDGIRALAVLAVILFHLDIPAFSGGFIGVDLFFVISGFLITQIVWDQKKENGFELWQFYLRRIRRLLPALYVTIVATFIGAAFILAPYDFTAFAKSTIAALFSVSNVLFFLEAGYWDISSDVKPLLHTWSLGVEEQFYLLWPIFLIISATWLRSIPFLAILVFVTVTSFLVTVWGADRNAAAAFYLLPFRVCQFSAGAMTAFLLRRPFAETLLNISFARDVFFALGIGLAAFGFVCLDETPLFPGSNVLLPMMSAVFLLFAGGSKDGPAFIGTAILSNIVSTFLGRVSYALYLVHWPLIVLYRYNTDPDFTVWEQVGLFVGSLALAVLLHFTVERRFYRRNPIARDAQQTSPAKFAVWVVSGGALVALVAGHAVLVDGWGWRFPNVIITPGQLREANRLRFVEAWSECNVTDFPNAEICQPRAPDARNVLFIGNSHEADAYNFISAGYGDDPKLNFITFRETNHCPDLKRTADGWKTDSNECQQRLDALFAPELVNALDVVIYAANQPFHRKHVTFLDMMTDLQNTHDGNLKVIVYGGYINTKIPCARLIEQTGSPATCASSDNVSYFEADPASKPLYNQVMAISDYYIDRVALHCPERRLDTCETETPDGVPYSYDETHLLLDFARYAGRRYSERYPDLFSDVLIGASRNSDRRATSE